MGRLTDRLLGWLGLVAVAAGLLGPFVDPRVFWLRWWLVGAGAVLLAAFAVAVVRRRRLAGALGPRAVRFGLNTALAVLLLLGIVVLIEVLSVRYAKRLDLTETRRHSLSLETVQVLGRLAADIHAVGFFRGDQPTKKVAEDLLKRYASHGKGRFTWKIVDPDREPGLARRYGVEAYGTIVLETKDKSEKVLDAEEEKLTNGLLKVTRAGKRVVYLLQGHGEHDPGSAERDGFSEARKALEGANYAVKPLVLARTGKLPEDAAVVVVARPKHDLLPPETAALDAYVARGGKLLVMANPFENEGLKRYLARYGIELGDNLVVELNPIGRLFGIGPEVPVVETYDGHAITRDLAGVATLFPLVRSVGPVKAPPEGVRVQVLARSSADSWGETDRKALDRGQAKPDREDPKGPLPVAAVATKDKARIVVYGTSRLASNQYLNIQGNRDFFLNTVSWLAEDESQITVRARDQKPAPVFLTAQQAQVIFFLPVVVVPGLIAAGGIVAFVRRRARR